MAAAAAAVMRTRSPMGAAQRSPIASSRVISPASHYSSKVQPPPDVPDQSAPAGGSWTPSLLGKDDMLRSTSALTDKGTRSGATNASSGALRRRRSSRRSTDPSSMTLGQSHFPLIASIVKSKRFEMAMGAVIFTNCITMGLEAELLLGKAQNLEIVVQISEHVITAVFLAELILRALVFGWRSFAPLPGTLWNFLDAVLVLVTGVLVVWILPLFGIFSASLQTLTVLRALRLARLVRVLHKFEAFHEVWLLLRGLMESGRVLFWTIVVIFFITYMFAVFGVVLIGVPIKEEYEEAFTSAQGPSSDLQELVDVTDGVLPLMYTLIQVLTLDSWNAIARPMMKYISWSWVFWYLYIAIAVIVMMNLVTAVIVENALKNSQNDADALLQERQRQKQSELTRFRQVFDELDLNGDGELSWEEFESAFDDKELSSQLRLLGVEPENCREMFDIMDTGDGVLSVGEFFEGISCMEGAASAKDLLRTNRTVDLLVKIVCQQNQELREDMDELLRLTPGATVHSRKGSLKSRARRQQTCDDALFHTVTKSSLASETVTIASSPCAQPVPTSTTGTAEQGRCFRRAQQVTQEATLGDVMARLEQVAGMVHDSRHECQESLEVCQQRICALSSDMCDLKSEERHRVNPYLPHCGVVPIPSRLEDDAARTYDIPASSSRWRTGLDSASRGWHPGLPLAPDSVADLLVLPPPVKPRTTV